MKKQFVIFFSIVLTVYAAIHTYLYAHAVMAIPEGSPWRPIFTILFSMIAITYLAGRFLERAIFSRFTTALVWIGSFWLGAMVYFLLIAVAIDVLRLIDWAAPFLHHIADTENPAVRGWLLAGVVTAVLITAFVGYVNARSPRVTHIQVRVAKPAPWPSLIIAVASDIHLGTVIGKKRLARIVHRINSMQPDLVLLPGDVIDEDLRPVIEHNLGDMLRSLRSAHGVYAITGNHEYIGGADKAVAYLREHGIHVLRDETAVIEGAITLVGREDRSSRQFAGIRRRSLADLMESVDRSKPVILLDHQPFGLHEAVECGVDLQLSGHTHHGQLWPFHLLTQRIFEVSWGYKRIENTHVYVSSGVGFWGPPMRIGNRPEIVKMEVVFTQDETRTAHELLDETNS